jgi:hypothetical protein
LRDKQLMRNEDSEDQLEAVLATVNEWYDAFMKSPEFARLSNSHQRKAGAITEFFAKYAYEHLSLTPGKWDRDAVEECCTEILPRKVSVEIAYFEAIAPVLSAFFNFLGNQSLLRNGRVLAQVVEDLDDEIVANAEDCGNWSPAKHFVMAALDAGVDIHEPGALEAFVLQFNLRQLARSQFANAARSSASDTPTPSAGKRNFQPPASRHDPCPCGSGKKYKFCCEPKQREFPAGF